MDLRADLDHAPDRASAAELVVDVGTEHERSLAEIEHPARIMRIVARCILCR
jgi:hypothetical protein